MRFPLSGVTVSTWKEWDINQKLTFLEGKVADLERSRDDTLYSELYTFFHNMFPWMEDPLEEPFDERLHQVMRAYQKIENERKDESSSDEE